MKIVDVDALEWHNDALSHREGRIAFKYVMEGDEGTPDNFGLVLSDEGADFFSPRHRHPWDQIRFCVAGSVPIGPRLSIDAGEVGYFPEGVYYGPQDGDDDRKALVLQFGGASGQGYLSDAQIKRGRRELHEFGNFEGGVFKRTDGDRPKNQDGYEAIWEQVTGNPVIYPKPRYKGPLIMQPDGFEWTELAAGVRQKSLGRFSEREVGIGFVAIDAAAEYEFSRREGEERLLFVHVGRGQCADQGYGLHTTVRLEPNESIKFAAKEATEILAITLPRIGRNEVAVAAE